MEISWLSILIGFAVAGLLFNLSRIYGASIKKKKAQKNLRKIEREIDQIKRELQKKSDAIKKSLEQDLKEVDR